MFEGLLTNKRYELVIKDNLGKYQKDVAESLLDLKKQQNKANLLDQKVKSLETENAIKDQAVLKMEQTVQNQMKVIQ